MTNLQPEADYLGLGSRLMNEPSELLAVAAFGDELRGAEVLHELMSEVDKAHVIGLLHAGVIEQGTAEALVRALDDLGSISAADFPWDPHHGDIYNNRDRWLRESIDAEAGWLSTGRARRESTTGAWVIAVRQRLVALHSSLAHLVNTILDVASAHTDTLMSDFTYLQHAHPTTLAHYLTGFSAPLARDLDRVERTIRTFNESPLGIGSTNGSRFGIDREFVARLLCFDAVRVHTRDAMWSPDSAIECASTMAIAATTVGRFVDELLIWSTLEFGYFECHDSHSRASVIMPQKKNPYGLTHVRGTCRIAAGVLSSTIATQVSPTGQPDNRIFSYNEMPIGLDRFIDSVDLLAEILEHATFNRSKLRAAAETGYTYATELCDALSQQFRITNRAAHRIVGAAVRVAASEDREVSLADVNAAAEQVAELPTLGPEHTDIARAMDPAESIARRATLGGAGTSGIRDILQTQRRCVDASVNVVAAMDCHTFTSTSRQRLHDALATMEDRTT